MLLIVLYLIYENESLSRLCTPCIAISSKCKNNCSIYLFLSLNRYTVGSIIFALKILNFVVTKLKLTF